MAITRSDRLEPTRWRKKPVEVEAMKVTVDAAGWPSAVVTAWCGGVGTLDAYGARIAVSTRIGTMYALPDDWIVKDANGDFYSWPTKRFEATYEPA
jgi:hypothetical protein